MGRRAFWKQGGIVGRKPREGVPPNAKHRSREWEESPEVTLAIVDSVDEAIDLFNATSPQFAASLISADTAEHQRFYLTN